jgi:hypothetical protein
MVFIQSLLSLDKLHQLQWTLYVVYNIVYTMQLTRNYMQLLYN